MSVFNAHGQAGDLAVRCPATGLSLQLGFKAGAKVKGSVYQLLGEGSVKMGTITGCWDDRIVVTVPDYQAEGAVHRIMAQCCESCFMGLAAISASAAWGPTEVATLSTNGGDAIKTAR
jgi:hypothetical protein